MNTFRNVVMPVFGVLAVLTVQVFAGASAGATAGNAGRSIAPYFTPATPGAKAPDPNGFLQRWLLLEPIKQSIRSNTVFTDTWVQATLKTEYFATR